jgi:outer membrane receptor protein involved in Fe transport
VTAEYSQQMTFLPGAFKGLSVFGSITRTIADRQQLRLSPKSANGGVRYRYSRVHAELRGTWVSARLLSSTFPLNGNVWAAERTLFDLSGGYRLSEHVELMMSIRNLFNTPATQYSNEPGRLYLYDVYGTIWNVGVKGRF